MDILGLLDGFISFFSASRKSKQVDDDEQEFLQSKTKKKTHPQPDLTQLHTVQRQLKQVRKQSRESARKKQRNYATTDRDM